MPYQPKRGGTIYNRKLAEATSYNRKIRKLIETIIENGADRATLNQYLVAITLLTTKIDDIIADLHEFDDKDTDQ